MFIALYIQTLFLFTFFEKKTKFPANPQGETPRAEYPSATVIVPVFNEEKTLAKTIESLLQLNYPADKLQIIVVDDGSTDHTWEIAESFSAHPQVRAFHKANGGKHTAMNLGLEYAQTELVGCLDADSFVDPQALIEIVKQFYNPAVMAVTPSVRVNEPNNFLQYMQHAEYDMSIFLRKMFGQMNAIHVTPGPFSFFRREVFLQLGGYRQAHNTEDFEMAMRLHKNHFPIANASTAYVSTTAPHTIKGLYQQRLRWIYGYLKNTIDYRELIFNKNYGNIGMFTLPAALISTVLVLGFTSFVIFKIGATVWQKIIEFQTVGWHLLPHKIYWSWFFFNPDTTSLLTLLLIAFSVTFVILGKRLVAGQGKPWSRGLLYFVIFYGFIAPVWIFKAVFNVIFGRRTAWR